MKLIDQNKKASGLSKADLNFLHLQTNLPLNRLVPLIEEPRDLDLIVDSICSRNFIKEDLKKLTPSLSYKFLIYSHSKIKSFDIEEKSFVSDIVINNFKKIQSLKKNSIPKPDKDARNEWRAKEYIVAAGLFPDKLKDSVPAFYYIDSAVNTYLHLERRDLALHIKDWVGILDNIKKCGWL